jgi:hypothetical protein
MNSANAVRRLGLYPGRRGVVKKFHVLTSLIGAFAIASSAMAEGASAQTKAFGLNISMSVNSTLHEADDANRSTYAQLLLAPTYAISKDWVASAFWTIDQELNHDRLVTPNDLLTSIRYGTPVKNDYASLSALLSANLPVSKRSRERDSLIVGMGAAARVGYDLARAKVPLGGMYQLGVGRNFHEYTVSTTGKSNSKYTVKNRLVVSLALLDRERLQVATDLAFSNNWSYLGEMTSSFSIGEELTYKVTPTLALATGIGNSGNMLKANGADSNFAVFNGETSEVYVSVSYTF